MSGVECPACGSFYEGHTNVYGKRCKCGYLIKPACDPEIIKEYKNRLKKYQSELRNVIRRKLG